LLKSRSTHIVQTSHTFYYTTTISWNVATKSCLIWYSQSCLTVLTDKKTESHANTVPSTAEKEKRSSAVLDEVLVASSERNKLLKQQH
jgi:hypothetical protein